MHIKKNNISRLKYLELSGTFGLQNHTFRSQYEEIKLVTNQKTSSPLINFHYI